MKIMNDHKYETIKIHHGINIYIYIEYVPIIIEPRMRKFQNIELMVMMLISYIHIDIDIDIDIDI